MGKLNAAGIAELQLDRARQIDALRVLISEPFDLNNPDHLQGLKKYIDDFELTSNLMYLYQGLKGGLMAILLLIPLKVIGLIITIPELVQTITSYVFYLGVIGHFVQKWSTSDFVAQYEHTQLIYNWCLKNGKEQYSTIIDNTEKLSNPEVQRMIRLLAPFSSTQFMVVWPRESTSEPQIKGIISSAISLGYSAVSTVFAGTSSGLRSNPDQQQRIRELKTHVEMRHLDIGVFDGMTHALKYFGNRPEISDLWHKLKNAGEYVRELPGLLGGTLKNS